MNQVLTVLFVGGPLHGVRHEWVDPPDYHPHVTATGMVPYSRRADIPATANADAIYAPVGMTYLAVTESLGQLLPS